MKKQLPYIPWYHGDFLKSTQGWSLWEQAVYWKLLCAQWDLGRLPIEPRRLIAIVGCDFDQFIESWKIIGTKFVEVEGSWVNERMEEHRRKYLEYCQKQSENGRKGGRATWKTKSNVVDFPQGGDSQ